MVRRNLGALILWGFVAILAVLAGTTHIFAGTATTSDDFYVADELEVDGSLDVAGAIAAGGNISTSGDVLATEDVEAGDDLIAGDDVIAGDAVAAGGAITAAGNISTLANLVASGIIYADDASVADSLYVGGNAVIAGNQELTGDLDANSDADVADSLYVGGNIVGGDSLYITTDAEIGDKLWCADLDVSDDAVFDDDVTISGEFDGAVCAITFGADVTNQTADRYLNAGGGAATGSNFGLPQPKDGSIIAASLSFWVDSYTPVATGDIDVYVDGVEVYSVTHTVDATGIQIATPGSQARDTDTFTAGQWISFKFDIGGTIQYDRPQGMLLVQYDD